MSSIINIGHIKVTLRRVELIGNTSDIIHKMV